jgi:sugar phosphate isomerase/epimerase
MSMTRRKLLAGAGLAAGALTLGPRTWSTSPAEPLFPVSLAQWSLHRTYFGGSLTAQFRADLRQDPDSVLKGDADPLDFPVLARSAFGIEAVEYVNTFYFGHARDEAYFAELKRRADGEGVRSLLIMCDALGNTGDETEAARQQAVENHQPWLAAAANLGCHAIRVNAAGQGSREEVSRRVAESLHALGERAQKLELSVLVENHGGYSSDGGWLATTIARADHPSVGTLPDFGNFRISPRGEEPVVSYDRYRGVEELMRAARAVSAKSYDFDEAGLETTIDYPRMLRIVADAGYRGHIGVEYEGRRLPEFEGIRATRDLILRIGAELAEDVQLPSKPS